MPDELTWLPAWQIRDLISKRDVSPVEVVDHFLARIEEHDHTLKSFAYVDAAGARVLAKAAEKAVLDGDELGTLHGIPVSVKGHIFVEGWPTFDMGSGTNIPAAPRNDVQVERLRAAGAIVVGANTLMASGARFEMAMTDPSRMYNWDVEARNPWDQSRVPGWSSSGTAAATCARPGADRSRFRRRRLHPAAVRVLRASSASWRHRGASRGSTPARRRSRSPPAPVRCAGTSSTAPSRCRPWPVHDGRDYFSLIDEPDDYLADIHGGVEGMRFAWSDDLGFASMYAMEESPRVIAAIREAAFGFAQIGAEVEPTDEAWDDFYDGFMLINRAFGSGGRGTGDKPSDAEYWTSMESRGRNVDKFDRLFETYDVLLTPTAQLLAREVEDWNDCWTGDGSRFAHGNFAGTYTSHVMLFNWLSMPAFSVPCGFVDGLPVGLQIVGKPGTEAKMLRIAQAFEQAFPRPERPAFE